MKATETKQIELWHNEAAELVRLEQWQKAATTYKKIFENKPTDARALRWLGEIYYRLGSLTESKKYLKRLAELYSINGWWAKAVSVNKILLKIDPADHEIQDIITKLYALVEITLPTKGSDYEPIIDLTDEVVVPAPGIVEINQALHQDFSGSAPATGYFASFVGLEDDLVVLKEKNQVDFEKVRIPLFSDFSPSEFSAVMDCFVKVLVPAGKVVCREGEVGSSVYVVASGQVKVSVQNAKGESTLLDHLESGGFFGEFGLLADNRRHATVTTTKPTELLEISKSDFNAISRNHPRVTEVLDRYYRERIVDNILAQSKLFKALNLSQRKLLLKSLALKKVAANISLIRQGDPSGDLFFIKAGRFAVTIERFNKELTVAELAPGDFFGELGFLTGKARTASVKSRGAAEVLVLNEQEAKKIFAVDPQIKTSFEKTIVESAQADDVSHLYYKMMQSNLALV